MLNKAMAVYTKVSEAEAQDFLALYDIGTLRELTAIKQGVENSNYHLITDRGRYILTLYEKRVLEEDLPFFMALMRHLADRGLLCPEPIATRDGAVLQHLNKRPAAVTSFLNGTNALLITAEHCRQVGRALAQMHLATQDFPGERMNALALNAWPDLFARSAEKADTVKTGLHDVIARELEFLKTNWPQDLPRGVIHADLFPDNVLFHGEELSGLIDFYFACTDFYAYDLAIVMNAWCFEQDVAFNITKARALLRGYEEARPLSAAEKKALPLLARGSAMRFLLTRLYDWLNQEPGALVRAKSPLEYLTRLEFHQRIANVTAYGIDT